MADKGASKAKKPWGTPIKKQQSLTIRPIPAILSSQAKKAVHPAETKNKFVKSPNSTEVKRPNVKTTESVVTLLPIVPRGRVPLDVVLQDYRDLARPSKKVLWKSMSEDQRQLKTKKFLNAFVNDAKIMNDVLTNYRDGDGLRKELSNLPAVYSMFGDGLPSSETTTTDKNIKSLVKETRDIEIQAGEEQTGENDLKSARSENVRLCSDLDAANKMLEGLKCELREKTRQLKNQSEKTEKLSSEINSLFDAEKEKEKIEEDMLNELSETKKEKDKIAGQLTKLKDEHTTLKDKYIMEKSEADAMRAVKFVCPNKLISEKDDEIESKNVKVEYLENIIAEYREEIENSMKYNRSIEAEVEELKENVNSWETEFNCRVDNYIHDKVKPEVEKLVNENDLLKTNNDQLMDDHQQFISESKVQINKLEKCLESREALINEQNKIIKYACDSKSKPPVAADNGWTLRGLFRW